MLKMGTAFFTLVMAAAVGACDVTQPTQPAPTGDRSTPMPSPTPSPAPIPEPATTTVPATNGGVPGVYRRDVVMSLSGMALVSLIWADADHSLQLYVTSGACADITHLLIGGCTIVGKTRPGDLPGLVRSPVTSGDLITTWVLNPDPAPQSFKIDMSIE